MRREERDLRRQSHPGSRRAGEDCVEHQVDYGGTLLTTRLCEPGTVCSQGTCVEAGLPGEACPVEGACYGSLCEDDVCVVLDPNTCACD